MKKLKEKGNIVAPLVHQRCNLQLGVTYISTLLVSFDKSGGTDV
jgi:hypothetical protein